MEIRGRVWKFGDNVDTDLIIPGMYLSLSDPAEFAKHCLEGADPSFASKVRAGDVIVAGSNFGCGSSREHAPLALHAAGVGAIVARSFARIFFRNAINIGLPVLESDDLYFRASSQDELMIDFERGLIKNLTTGETFKAMPYPSLVKGIIRAGGLVPYVRARLERA